VQALKGLMDRTGRRFKAVFAGLHNVQRACRLANQPLAPGHFGDPLCIGPLINNGEARAARELIERPLAALGYRFSSDDLVMRILAFTGYYPHLIQLFCANLLRYLQGSYADRFDVRTSPPYEITSEHLDAVMDTQELRDQVRDRFVRSLDLDKRYLCIALVLAHHAHEAAQLQRPQSMSAAELRDAVQCYWPAGFAQHATDEVLAVLLEEMAGLGVVAKRDDGRYALRGNNVAQLLGTQQELADRLLGFERERPPEPYRPEIFRGKMPDAAGSADPTRPSPLTLSQESVLRNPSNGVAVVFGTRAAGLHDLSAFLRHAVGEDNFHAWDHVRTAEELLERLQELRQRQPAGLSLALIPADVPWTPTWIEQVLAALQRYYAGDRFTRLVFLADPDKTWEILSGAAEDWATAQQGGTQIICLAPWHDRVLEEWLDDCEFGIDAKQEVEHIAECTGNWPLVLAEFLRHSGQHRDQWQEALERLAREFAAPQSNATWLQAWGLAHHAELAILRVWAEVETVSAGDLAEVADVDEARAMRVLRWAELLCIATASETPAWRLNGVVATCLKAHPAAGR
jgi:hypothetical protein